MKPMPVLLLVFLLAAIMANVGAQSSVDKQGKGNTKNDQYMTNEFYKTKPLTTEGTEKGASKTSKHHIERLKDRKHNGPESTVSVDAMPEPKRSQLMGNTSTSGVAGNGTPHGRTIQSGKRQHTLRPGPHTK
jgi:hypothetical protein